MYCGRFHYSEIIRRLETQLKEHKEGLLEKSAVAEHAWTGGHKIMWDQTTVVDRANRESDLDEGVIIHKNSC